MIDFQPDIHTIERWAYTTELDEEFDQYQEDDSDLFELAISKPCTLQDYYRFAADTNCLKREFFAHRLVPELAWVYAFPLPLPFHFSRLQGIKGREIYLAEVADIGSQLHDRALLIEQMRTSEDPALQSFSKVLLDHRWQQNEVIRSENIQLRRKIAEEVLPLFATQSRQ